MRCDLEKELMDHQPRRGWVGGVRSYVILLSACICLQVMSRGNIVAAGAIANRAEIFVRTQTEEAEVEEEEEDEREEVVEELIVPEVATGTQKAVVNIGKCITVPHKQF